LGCPVSDRASHPDSTGVAGRSRRSAPGAWLTLAALCLAAVAVAGVLKGARAQIVLTQLHGSIQANDAARVRQCLEEGADPKGYLLGLQGGLPLSWALERDHVEIARILIDHGARVEAPGLGMPIILTARSPEAVRLLVGRGAPVNARDDQGKTALFWARSRGDAAVVRELTRCGGTL
jgi:hypothetical protein